MSGIIKPLFPDEGDFRAALGKHGIIGPALELLVRDECANRRQQNMSRRMWDSCSTYALMTLTKGPVQGASLPSPEMVAAVARMIIAAEICTAGEDVHPALSVADKPDRHTGSWCDAICGALHCETRFGPIQLEPCRMGTALSLQYQEAPAIEPGKLASLTILCQGDNLLPRSRMSSLALEALHRLTGTKRRGDLPASKLQGVMFAGTAMDWCMLLAPITGEHSPVNQPEAPSDEPPSLILPKR
jgi:hypothetical protein